MRYLLLLPVLSLVASAPRTNVVQVVGTDYAFTVPAAVSAGRTTFVFRNNGKHAHEFNAFLLKPGVTIDQFLERRRAGKPEMGTVVEGPVGVLFAEPGSTAAAKLTVNLIPGREYGIICIFSDSANAPRHYDLGMYKVIRVVAAGAAPAARPPVDSIIATDYAYPRYPRELSPGVHEIAFRNAGKKRHEFLIGLLKKGVTLDSVIALEKKKIDPLPLFDLMGPGGVLYSTAGNASLGNMVIDFLPGREYAFECTFQDDAKSPTHNMLGMYGSIKVKNR
jgi:uncharacterized cupredoxin-like copper-binding protein